MNLTDHFISSPLSALLTILFGLSLYAVSNYVGEKIFKQPAFWLRPMFFFCGILLLSWVAMLLSVFGWAHITAFRVLFWITIASGILSFYFSGFSTGIKAFGIPDVRLPGKIIYLLGLAALALLLITSLAPPTDADSLDYHLGVPVAILRQGDLWLDKNQLHFRMFGLGEMINLIGVANGCAQLGSFIQFLSLASLAALLLQTAEVRVKPATLALILGVPVLLFLLPSQKHQLTGAIITSVCFYAISHHTASFNRRHIAIIAMCVCMAVGLKYSFFISAFALGFLFMLRAKDHKQRLWMAGMQAVFFLIFCGPLLTFKAIHFGDPVSPVLEAHKAVAEPTIVAFHSYIKNYRDTHIPFPLSLVLPASPGSLSTILGVSILVILAPLFFFRRYKAVSVTIILFAALVIAGGQKTSRFFIEPYYWALPLLLPLAGRYLATRGLVVIGQIQFLSLLPFFAFGAISLGQGIISNSHREKVLSKTASFYDEVQWLNSIIRNSAVVCTDIRSRSLLKHQYFPPEYLLDTGMMNPARVAIMDSMIYKQYKAQYLVLMDNAAYKPLTDRYAGDTISASKEFFAATRNPFNRTTYKATIYRIKTQPAQ